MNSDTQDPIAGHNSELIVKRPAGMLRVWDHTPLPQINDQIELFERDLANEIGKLIGDFYDAKDAAAPCQSQLDGRTHAPLFDPIGHGSGSDTVDLSEAKL